MGGRSFPPNQIGAAIQMYYTGSSFRQAAKKLKDRFDIQDTDVSPQTIQNWVRRFTEAAIRMPRDLKRPGGGKWWVFNRITSRPLPRFWMMVLDDETGYILGNCVHAHNEYELLGKAMDEAMDSVRRPCDEFVSLVIPPDWYSKSPPGSELVPWVWTEYQLIGGYYLTYATYAEYKDDDVPRFAVSEIFREYWAACARFERIVDIAELRRYLAGWVITRNWSTTQKGLGGRTPGQAAGIESSIPGWIDVVRLEAQAFLNTADLQAAVATRHPSEDAREQIQ